MSRKIVPDEKLLNQILTRYKETGKYSVVAREVGLSPTTVKRIIIENTEYARYVFVPGDDLPVEPVFPISKEQYYEQLRKLAEENEDG